MFPATSSMLKARVSRRRTRTSSSELARRCRAGRSSRSPRTDWPEETGETYEENARHEGAGSGTRWRRRTSGCSARTPGSSATRSTARPGCTRRAGRRRGDQADALLERLGDEPNRRARMVDRARGALARRRGAPRASACSRARSRSAARRRAASATTRSSSRTGTSGRSPSSATTGSASTRTAGSRRRRWRRPFRARRAWGAAVRSFTPHPPTRSAPGHRAQLPVDLGAEHDHVRHHVEPDEQQRLPRERTQHRVVARDADELRQQLERRLERAPRRDRARAAPRATSASTFVST